MSVAPTIIDSTSSHASSNPCTIDRLPNELLSEIFQHCVAKTAREFEGDPNPVYGQHPSCTTFILNFDALVISQVNRRWRNISLGEPTLWRRVYVTLSHYVSAITVSFVEELVLLYLVRSKDSPLDVSLIFSKSYSGYQLEELDSDYEDHTDGEYWADECMGMIRIPFPIFMTFLRGRSEQWRSATFQFHDSMALYNLYHKFPHRLPILEELDLRVLRGDDDDEDYPFTLPYINGSLLRKIHMERFSRTDACHSSLDDISLAFVDVSTVISFLADASTQCRAEISEMLPYYKNYGPAHVTSSLVSLSFITADNSALEYPLATAFSRLTLPNVQELVFINKRTDGLGRTIPPKEFLSLLGRSSSCFSKLTRLHLEGYYIGDKNLLKVLGQLYALTDLTIKEPYLSFDSEEYSPLTEHFMKGLTSGSPSRSIAPNLLRVEFEIRSGVKAARKAYYACLSFLKSRRPTLQVPAQSIGQTSVATLQQAKIFLPVNLKVSKTSGEVLSKLRAEGLAVEVTDNLLYEPPWYD